MRAACIATSTWQLRILASQTVPVSTTSRAPEQAALAPVVGASTGGGLQLGRESPPWCPPLHPSAAGRLGACMLRLVAEQGP